MGRRHTPEFGGRTLLLETELFLLFIVATGLAVAGLIPMWVGAISNTVFLYAIYTVVHEAVHANISSRHKNLRWVDTLAGVIACAPLWLNYHQHKRQHMAHHAHTNEDSDPDIYAAGDCCSFPHRLFGNKRMRLEAWRNATDQANVATGNMLGGNNPYLAVPWFWSDQYDLSLQIAGSPADGVKTVRRQLAEAAFVMFHLDGEGRLVAASGIGPGNSIARDVKLAEMLIARRAAPAEAALADVAVQLKALLKG